VTGGCWLIALRNNLGIPLCLPNATRELVPRQRFLQCRKTLPVARVVEVDGGAESEGGAQKAFHQLRDADTNGASHNLPNGVAVTAGERKLVWHDCVR